MPAIVSLLQRLLPNLRRRLAAVAACQLVAVAAEAVFIAFTVHWTANLGAGAPPRPNDLWSTEFLQSPSVGTIAAVVAAAIVVRAMAQSGAVWLWARGVQEYERLHRRRLLDHLLRAEWILQVREPAGRLQHLLTHHAESLSKAYTALAWSCVHALTAAALAAAAIASAPQVTAGGLLFLLAGYGLMRPVVRRSRKAAQLRARALGAYVHLIGQATGMFRELRVFGAEGAIAERAAATAQEMGDARCVQNVAGAIMPAWNQAAAGLLLAAGLAAAHFSGGDGAAVVVSIALLLRAASSAQHLYSTLHQLQEVRPFLVEIVATADAYEQAAIPRGGLPPPSIESLELCNIAFAYDDDRPVVSGVNLTLRRGEVVALVGASGGGKSTLAHLLLQLLRPTSGELSINGRPSELYDRQAWFRRIGFLAQEPALFHESIADCIRFGRRELTEDQIRSSAGDAGLSNDLTEMPHGLQTQVGERGTALSYGQRQRICLARALACDPELLVLDEPTAALDSEAEERIVQTIERLRGKALVVVVTHRPAILRACDRVIEVRDGIVVERSVGAYGPRRFAKAA